MTSDEQAIQAVELADGMLSGPEWERWLAQHPEVAEEVLALRQARLLTAQLRARQIEVPDDFEARVMAQLRRDVTFHILLSFGLPQLGTALIEFLSALFGLLPPAGEEQPSPLGGSV